MLLDLPDWPIFAAFAGFWLELPFLFLDGFCTSVVCSDRALSPDGPVTMLARILSSRFGELAVPPVLVAPVLVVAIMAILKVF